MKKLLVCFIAVAAVLMTGSCAKDYGYAPEYGIIKVAPADAYPGDSLTATIEMLRPGNGVYKGDFVWTIDGVEYKQTIVNDLSVYAPQFGFRAPAAGTHPLTVVPRDRICPRCWSRDRYIVLPLQNLQSLQSSPDNPLCAD